MTKIVGGCSGGAAKTIHEQLRSKWVKREVQFEQGWDECLRHPPFVRTVARGRTTHLHAGCVFASTMIG